MSPRYAEVGRQARAAGLDILGAFHPGPEDGCPPGTGTLLLLGPLGTGFWSALTDAPEWQDGAPDPVDRWSARVIGQMANGLGAKALFPFTGPPWHPFVAWALRSGRAWASPVTLLVHAEHGLMVSYRGALALVERLDLPPPPPASPCERCVTKPCLGACPASALSSQGYDTAACHTYLDTRAGQAGCMQAGCAVRRACPVSRGAGRPVEQSAYHMSRFHRR